MRVIMAGGGTGGHLFPGLAVAREFQQRDPMTEVVFIGTEQGIESRILQREGFPLEVIPVKGIKGRGTRGALEALYGLPVSLLRSLRIIKGFRPNCIIGLGGYASGPVLVAGKLKGIRCTIMEQNVRPGFTNKILAWVVDRIFTAYRESTAHFSYGHIVETGNPVRWRTLPEVKKSDKFTLLVFGGSAGAHRLNVCVIDAMRLIADIAPGLRVIHQTGQADFTSIREAYEGLPFEAEVHPFIERMDEAYAHADLVLCRAGATTVAELTAYGKAAILVPYPYATYDHQRLNALALHERGAAEMILDRELNGQLLAERVRNYVSYRKQIEAMAAAARTMGRPGAAARIVDECYALVYG